MGKKWMFERAAFRLLGWFESHNKGQGEYYSNAHHPIWGVENKNQLPHTFHYYGIILSYITLYKKLKKEKYLEKAKEAADILCSLQKWSGQFQYDTFEFNTIKPTGLTLIHNALPSIALLELYKISKEKKYLYAAKKNIGWFYSRLWNGKYLSGCVNQDLCAAEALALLYEVEGNPVYKKRAMRIADTMLTLQISDGMLKGGFIRGFNERELTIPWYDALTALSYHHMASLCNEEKYRIAAKATAEFIKKNLSNEGLVHWYMYKGKKWNQVKEPLLIAPAGVALSLLKQCNIKTNVNLFQHQKTDGSFPLSYYFKDARMQPNLGWNQFMLLYLCAEVEQEISIKESERKKEEYKEEAKPGIEIKIASLSREGYVDVLRDYFCIKSYKVIQRKVTIAENDLKERTLRFRMINSRWKIIQPNTRFLKVRIMPYGIIYPYVIAEELITRILKIFFAKPLFDSIIKIKMWRK